MVSVILPSTPLISRSEIGFPLLIPGEGDGNGFHWRTEGFGEFFVV
jgi:hypothetical protein